MAFEHEISSIEELKRILYERGVQQALLKVLPKNANDKNQVYIASDFRILHPAFSLTFNERGLSTSKTKRSSSLGKSIPEAVFNQFHWLRPDGTEVRAKSVKAIIYAQYPEARLSGFQTVENNMPESMSVSYTKKYPDSKRLLVLGQCPGGAALAMMVINLSDELLKEIAVLPGFGYSRICKKLEVDLSSSDKLNALLSGVVGKSLRGCRFDRNGNTIPFTGTQVCGYTLEHACGIRPNADKEGDYLGIELKAHTNPKVTLFTPEPDFGLYAEDFKKFMTSYGYQDKDGNYRFTGLHRAGIRAKKSGLTLKVRQFRVNEDTGEIEEGEYDPSTTMTSKMDSVDVVLQDNDGNVAAGWSVERLLNNWDVKHNEVVYVTARKSESTDANAIADGYKYIVEFDETVLWCSNTSADQLFNAINDGTIFLDPAPKYDENNPANSKRRSQWRVNSIHKAVYGLYESVEERRLK